MTKEQQDLAWAVLPKEFKEEVKKEYKNALRFNEYAHECVVFRNLFGHHNLTSDAEGEEMLYVSRKKAQKLYSDYCAERDNEEPGSNRSSLGGRIAMLQDLFGSKCLPDNVATSEPNVDSLAPNVDSLAMSSAPLSQNPAENCDNENHISKSERLHIAASLLQGLLANAVWVMRKTDLAAKAAADDNTKAAQILTNDLAEDALEFADALIKQSALQ